MQLLAISAIIPILGLGQHSQTLSGLSASNSRSNSCASIPIAAVSGGKDATFTGLSRRTAALWQMYTLSVKLSTMQGDIGNPYLTVAAGIEAKEMYIKEQ